ncbi:hypothetical protein ALC60_12991 [Trachymyrmex zeteki]|uniref:Uncharacterized protein n=1 Tax=Mycetomoellerius zeteki TaxID=64791 RepID=A0A151WJM0_9HYME|nr:hypothetical protein ALC60_12991 [Trachymyrmex zeteki]
MQSAELCAWEYKKKCGIALQVPPDTLHTAENSALVSNVILSHKAWWCIMCTHTRKSRMQSDAPAKETRLIAIMNNDFANSVNPFLVIVILRLKGLRKTAGAVSDVGPDFRTPLNKTIRKSRLAKSSKVSRESIAADAPPRRRAPPDKSGSMPEDDDAGHKHSRDKREEATSTTALRRTVIPMIRKCELRSD